MHIFKSVFFSVWILSCLHVFGQVKGYFYSIDTQHSVLDFKIKHIGFGSVRGHFDKYDGTIFFDSTDLFKTSASIVIQVETITTGNGATGRDGIIREEFFQVKKYPLIEFTSTVVVKRENQLYLIGDLSMGAFKKKVEIPFIHVAGPSRDQFNHMRIAFEGSLELNRKEYDLIYRSNEFWNSIIEDRVVIEMEVGARVYNSIETVSGSLFSFLRQFVSQMCCQV